MFQDVYEFYSRILEANTNMLEVMESPFLSNVEGGIWKINDKQAKGEIHSTPLSNRAAQRMCSLLNSIKSKVQI